MSAISRLRPFEPQDLRAVIDIIAGQDPEDADAARDSLRSEPRGAFVLEADGRIVGITGAEPEPAGDRTFWFRWTFLDPAIESPSLAVELVTSMLEELDRIDVRKVFAALCDTPGLTGGGEASIVPAFRAAGFEEELRHPGYYGPGEDMVILSAPLDEYSPIEADDEAMEPIVVTGIEPAEEAEDAWVIDWTYADGKRASSPDDVAKLLTKIERKGGRFALFSAPSDAEAACELARLSGFRELGRLDDFFADGIHDVHFRCEL